MEIIPAIDIRAGRCVRLLQGDYSKETIFADDPMEIAMKWEDEALDKVSRIPIPFIRNMAVKRIEQEVVKAGEEVVTLDLFEKYRVTF